MNCQKIALPRGLVIGPMKAGTSWIQDYAEWRGDVCLPRGVKETFFFDEYWDRGVEWYQSHFRPATASDTDTPRLEIGSSYFHNPNAPERVKAALGDIPLVITLRDPVRRAWSHYLHLRRYGHTKSSLEPAVEEFPEIIEASRYQRCLARWYAVFPPENMHFVWQDWLSASPDAYAASVCRALGLDHRSVPEELKARRNEASLPSSHHLAALGRVTTSSLRSIGLYGAVNVAKRLGLKRLFFGKPGSASNEKPAAEQQAWLEAQLANAIPPEAEAVRDAPCA